MVNSNNRYIYIPYAVGIPYIPFNYDPLIPLWCVYHGTVWLIEFPSLEVSPTTQVVQPTSYLQPTIIHLLPNMFDGICKTSMVIQDGALQL